MKLKQQPEDFQVEEVPSIAPGQHGDFALYRLEKRGWTTPDALALVRRRWQVRPERLSYGGLKDRHAATVQYFSILHGPRRNLQQQQVTVRYLGQVEQPFTSREITCNRFQIALRDLTAAGAQHIQELLPEVAAQGVPNYFDDQRFGSVAEEGGEFVGRLLVRGRFEDALKLALTAPYAYDRAEQKREKRVLAQHWGDWERCKQELPRGHARSLVDYLRMHPADFRGAIARLRPELRGLYLSAYQSHLWNRMLAAWLVRHCPQESLVPVELRLGPVPMHHGLAAEVCQALAALTLPLPSARLKLEPDDPRGEYVRQVLQEEGLELHDLQVRGLREVFFSRGERPALCMPADLAAVPAPDELHKGKEKMLLRFSLPRGCYATLIVKRLTATAVDRTTTQP
jgi:tRNA pseudouridine13 synthase